MLRPLDLDSLQWVLSYDKRVARKDRVVTGFVLDVLSILSETTRATVEIPKKEATHHKEMSMQRIQLLSPWMPCLKSQNE